MKLISNFFNQASLSGMTSFFILTSLLCACASDSSQAPLPTYSTNTKLNRPEKSPIEDGETFEQLEMAADYLAMVVQRNVDAQFSHRKIEPVLNCDPPQKTAEYWIMRIKSRLDVSIAREQQKYVSQDLSTRATNSRWTACDKLCLCGSYAEMIDQIDASQLTDDDHELVKKMRVLHGKKSAAEELRCAHSASWFCKSPLHNQLSLEN